MTAAVGIAREQNQNHEQVFLERYNQLLKWASHLTRPDQELAKDLVHEAFLQFTISAGDLVAINNLDGYLFGVVRNAYLSYLRTRSRQPHEQLPEFDFDSAETLLLAVDPRRQIQIKDELRAICQHACTRKDTSITASVLILRFFHGYVPSEVARVLNSSRNIVDVQLRSARYEVIACLASPPPAVSANHMQPPLNPSRRRADLTSNLLDELREEIFATRKGDCFEQSQLKKIYRTHHKAVTRSALSHFVSCPTCLDEINGLLALPLLRERNAIDTLGRATDTGESGPIYSFVRRNVMASGWLWWLLFASALNDLLA